MSTPPRLRQNGAVLWFTGLSGAGKTTTSVALVRHLEARGVIVVRLDGDLIRKGMSRDLGFAPEDRAENVRRVAESAAALAHTGVVVLVALISPTKASRDAARAIIDPAPFCLVHMATSLEVCEDRDPKGLYKRARAGAIPSFTGVSAPYEAPDAADLVLVGQGEVEASVTKLVDKLRELGVEIHED